MLLPPECTPPGLPRHPGPQSAEPVQHHRECIAKRLERDLEAMTALPGAPFDACHQATGQVSSQSLVRYHNNDYSVPIAYGCRQVWVRGYVDRVVIGCGAEIIARHPRSYEGEDMVFDPIHYLPLIERKIGALDQAAPLAGWELPDVNGSSGARTSSLWGRAAPGNTHVAQGLGLAACQRGLSVRFVTAAALVHELMEARDERRLLRLQKQFANHKLLIIDALGFVPLSKTGAELLFEIVSQR